MHVKLLEHVCCPACGGRLSLDGPPGEETVSEGRLACSGCPDSYEIVGGIPVLLPAEGRQVQPDEQESRERSTRVFSHSFNEQLTREISRHHYLPAMRREAFEFAGLFRADQWLLDVGAGWGWHWLGERSPQIVALDFSLPMLQVAARLLRRQVDSNIHLVCGDATRLPIQPNTMDGMWSAQMLQHLPPAALDTCLRLCAEAMRPGSPVRVYWLNWGAGDRLLFRLMGRRFPRDRTSPYYLRKTTANELAVVLEQAFDGQATARYNEVVFHPELRLAHRLPLRLLDEWLARVPGLNAWLARQVVGSVVSS